MHGKMSSQLYKPGFCLTAYQKPAQALKKVPGVNASWHGDFIRQYHNIDISIAVQTPSGLMVPVVKDSDSKGLTEIGSAVKDLAGKVCIMEARELMPIASVCVITTLENIFASS